MFAKRFLVTAAAILVVSACTTNKQDAPDLTGPSSLGVALDIKASPDIMYRDGVSQSVIEVTATDGLGRRMTDLNMVVTASPNLGTIQTQAIKTDATGRASTIYVAPGFGGTTTATITVTPQGSNFQNTVPRTITIRLFQPAS